MFEPDDLCMEESAVLVTGGTGSFGQAFVRFLLAHHPPRRLIIYSRDEAKQYEMAQELSPERHPCLRYFLGDVRDAERLTMAMREVDYVIHAAALKHVPAAEYNPFECIKTNVHGAENVTRAAIETRVRRVLALSTDKAVSPINLYGASKLAADKVLIASNNLVGKGPTRLSVVRYGNVVGSRGSVVPLFRRLIAAGASALPITDPRMTRFWITLPQGVAFVLSCLGLMRGGEIFVPKIPSMKVTDLAAALAPQLRQETVGIRPGEKLHEVLINEDDARLTVELPDRYVVEPALTWWLRDSYRSQGARPLPEGFRYASDSNGDWLDGPRLLALLAAT